MSKRAVAVRVGLFVFLGIVGLQFFPLTINLLLGPSGYVITAALGTFAAAAVANAISLRTYERGRLADIGLGWNKDSRTNLALGILGGIGAALVVLILPILTQQAEIELEPNAKPQWASLAFITIVLLFGAVGEEMLFRGYAFQVSVRAFGEFAAILPWAVLFGVAHMNNRNVAPLGVFNTFLWGVVLGYAFVRSGDLWLPVGLHFGWNWALPLMGVNLSGFTLNLTGLALHWKARELWSGGDYGPEGGIFTTGVVVALFVYLLRAPIRTQEAFMLREGPQDVNS